MTTSGAVQWKPDERAALLRACARGDVHRAVSGYHMWRNPAGGRRASYKPLRVDRKITQLAAEGAVELVDGVWRPTQPTT